MTREKSFVGFVKWIDDTGEETVRQTNVEILDKKLFFRVIFWDSSAAKFQWGNVHEFIFWKYWKLFHYYKNFN